MKVTLKAITAPSVVNPETNQPLTAEEFIVYCARVSNPPNQLNVETATKLLAYCIKNGHWSVFEQASMTLEIVTSRAISAQIIRHRSFSFQEFSQRYAEVANVEPVEVRRQGAKNHQGGEEVFDPPVVMPDESVVSASSAIAEVVEYCQDVYAALIQAHVAKECARMILPMCSQTTLYMTGSIRSWIHYLKSRLDPHAQKEHRLLADEACQIFREQFPNLAAAVWTS